MATWRGCLSLYMWWTLAHVAGCNEEATVTVPPTTCRSRQADEDYAWVQGVELQKRHVEAKAWADVSDASPSQRNMMEVDTLRIAGWRSIRDMQRTCTGQMGGHCGICGGRRACLGVDCVIVRFDLLLTL